MNAGTPGRDAFAAASAVGDDATESHRQSIGTLLSRNTALAGILVKWCTTRKGTGDAIVVQTRTVNGRFRRRVQPVDATLPLAVARAFETQGFSDGSGQPPWNLDWCD